MQENSDVRKEKWIRKRHGRRIQAASDVQLYEEMIMNISQTTPIVTPMPKKSRSTRIRKTTDIGVIENTVTLHLRIQDPDIIEAMERKLYLHPDIPSKAELLRTIYGTRYGIGTVMTKKAVDSSVNSVKVTFWSTALEKAFDDERESKGYTKRNKHQLHEEIISEALAPELASVKNGISRESAGEYIKSYEKENVTATKKDGKRKHTAINVYNRKMRVELLISQMDPVIFLEHEKEIREFLLGLK